MSSTALRYLLVSALLSMTTAYADEVILDFDGSSVDGVAELDVSATRINVLAHLDEGSSSCGVFALDPDGNVIVSFGNNGRLPTSGCGTGLITRGDDVLTSQNMNGESAVIVRGSDGQQLVTALSGAEGIAAFDVQTDGKYVGGGRGPGTRLIDGDWRLWRWNVNGSADATFGTAGVSTLDLGTDVRGGIDAVVTLATGKTLALGTVQDLNGNASVLKRFNADGLIDFTFGTNGTAPVPGSFGTRLLAVDATGNIYVADDATMLLRLNADGSTDGTFNAPAAPAGVTITDFALDSTGRVIVVGQYYQNTPAAYVARLSTTGGFDPAFGGTGELDLVLPRDVLRTSSTTARCQLAIQSGDRALIACSIVIVVDDPSLGGGRTDIMLARLDVNGVPDPAFGAGQADSDTYPNAFTFTPNSAPFGTEGVQSNAITVSGINGRTNIGIRSTVTAQRGYSVGCNGTFTRFDGTILPGQAVCLRHDSSSTPLGSITTTLEIGGRLGTYATTSTADGADITPDAFTFTEQANVARGTNLTSNTITVAGINGLAPISVQNGGFSIGCTSVFETGSSTIRNGDTVCVRHTSAATFGTTVLTVLGIGGVQATFRTTTLAGDSTPDAFIFDARAGVPTGSTVVSNTESIRGIEVPAALSVANGEYSVGCNGTFTSANGTIQPNQTICVRHVAAAQASTSVSTTLTVGGVTSDFRTTTAAPAASSSGGGNKSGGAMDPWLLVMLTIFTATLLRNRVRAAGRRSR